ncbi:unnamed protein product [marine sediment metagenome]|uniref:ABC transporter domain-containing protein n=1 Tax=marine sediment metagenome TaxID=412755 RepID=X1GNB2_9ZZZZ
MINIQSELPLIIVDSVNFTYPNGTVALRNINLNIKKGEIVILNESHIKIEL